MVQSHNRWVDSKTEIQFEATYSNIISPSVSLIPFIEHINTVRASLVHVYLNQAICNPCNKYHPGIVLEPNYNQPPCVISDNCNYDNPKSLDYITGLNLFAVFGSLELTYEDAIAMSRSAAS